MRDVAFFGRVPICGDELMKYGLERALRLLSGYAVLQTPHNVEAQPIALGENGIRAAGRLAPRAHIGFVVERNPQIRLGASGDAEEISRRDADDGKPDAVQRDALADDGGIARKAARPIHIADHHRARRARVFIGIGDTAPQKWPVTIAPSASVGSPLMPTVVFWSLKPSGTNAKTLDITFFWALNSLNSSYEKENPDFQPVIEKCGGHLSLSHWKRTRCCGSLTGRARSMMALMRLKMAVLPPMPRVSTATPVKPGDLR